MENEKKQTNLEKAEELAARIEEANKKTEELLERQEKLSAERMLGGRTEAGSAPSEKTEAELKKEGAKEFWKGSEIEKAIEKHG